MNISRWQVHQYCHIGLYLVPLRFASLITPSRLSKADDLTKETTTSQETPTATITSRAQDRF